MPMMKAETESPGLIMTEMESYAAEENANMIQVEILYLTRIMRVMEN